MWMQLNLESSKYQFLMTVHTAFGMADVGKVDWRFGLRREHIIFVLYAHSLEIETGRFTRPHVQRSMQYCSFCQQRGLPTLGDEAHALDVCPQFSEKRKRILARIKLFIPPYEIPADSIVELQKILDAYKESVRIEVWRAVAILIEHIQTVKEKR